MSKSWIYHRKKPAQIVDDVEVAEYLQRGWAETPAAFHESEEVEEEEVAKEVEEPNPKTFGSKPPEIEDAFETEIEEKIEEEEKPLPPTLENDSSLGMMTKSDLKKFTKDHFGLSLAHRLSRDEMEMKVRDLLKDQNGDNQDSA